MAIDKDNALKMAGNPWVKIIGLFILMILVANVTATLTQRTAAAELKSLAVELKSLKDQLELVAKNVGELNARTAGMMDIAEIKSNAEALQKAGENLDVKLNAVVKAEEAKLAILAKDLENQKAYAEELKSLLAGEKK